MHFNLSLSHNLVKMPVSNKRRRQLSLARQLWQRKRKLMADPDSWYVQIKGIDAEVSCWYVASVLLHTYVYSTHADSILSSIFGRNVSGLLGKIANTHCPAWDVPYLQHWTTWIRVQFVSFIWEAYGSWMPTGRAFDSIRCSIRTRCTSRIEECQTHWLKGLKAACGVQCSLELIIRLYSRRETLDVCKI